MLHASRDALCERLGVCETQIEALAGEGVNRVSGVANQSDAVAGVGGGMAHAEGEGGDGAFLDAGDTGKVGREAGFARFCVWFAPGEFSSTVAGCVGEHIVEIDSHEAESSVDHGGEVGGGELLQFCGEWR